MALSPLAFTPWMLNNKHTDQQQVSPCLWAGTGQRPYTQKGEKVEARREKATLKR